MATGVKYSKTDLSSKNLKSLADCLARDGKLADEVEIFEYRINKVGNPLKDYQVFFIDGQTLLHEKTTGKRMLTLLKN